MTPSPTTPARLTLPGDLPNLLRRAAPIVEREGTDAVGPMSGVVIDIDATGCVWAAFKWPSRACRSVSNVPLDRIALDLADDAGIDIAVRWAAERTGLVVGPTAPGWCLPDGKRIGWQLSGVGDERGRHAWIHFHDHDRYDGNEEAVRVPGILALTDPREALRAVCMRLAGRAE